MMTQAQFDPATAVARRHIGLLSTYPPQLCGLATFAAALELGLKQGGSDVDVVRIDDDYEATWNGRPVTGNLIKGVPASLRHAAAVLSQCDVAVVQHEYGIYGGDDGEEILDVLEALDVPSIVTLHTVPLRATERQRAILTAIAEHASRLVVMTKCALDRLLRLYPVDASRVVVIPHGALVPTIDLSDRPVRYGDPVPELLTWGLLGPGKGIEHTLDALALLNDFPRRPRYTVAGVTHPKVLARDGNAYRHFLIERARHLGIDDLVTFDDTYRDVERLTHFVESASVVVLPYNSRDQVTSGVLVDAIAAGRPVIATEFPHAVEMLSSGAGILVHHADPAALADAIKLAFTDTTALASMAAEARRLAPSLSWTTVAGQYATLADELLGSRQAIAM